MAALLIIRWLALRLLVATLCVATVLSLARLTVHLLILAYANIPPYTGVG
jgi:hypothetical protein